MGNRPHFSAVLHLAELSNDPLGENKPEVTYEINHQGSLRIAELAKAAGLVFRPLSETIAATLAEADPVDGVGLTPEREPRTPMRDGTRDESGMGAARRALAA